MAASPSRPPARLTCQQREHIKEFQSFATYIRKKTSKGWNCDNLIKTFLQRVPRYDQAHTPRLLHNLLSDISSTPATLEEMEIKCQSIKTLSIDAREQPFSQLEFVAMHQLAFLSASEPELSAEELWNKMRTWLGDLQAGFAFSDFEAKESQLYALIHTYFLKRNPEWIEQETLFVETIQYYNNSPLLSHYQLFSKCMQIFGYFKEGMSLEIPDAATLPSHLRCNFHHLDKSLPFYHILELEIERLRQNNPILSPEELAPLLIEQLQHFKNLALEYMQEGKLAETLAKIFILNNFKKTVGPLSVLIEGIIDYQFTFWPFLTKASAITQAYNYCKQIHQAMHELRSQETLQWHIDVLLHKIRQWIVNKHLFMSYPCFENSGDPAKLVETSIQAHENLGVSHEVIIQHASEAFKTKAASHGLEVTERHLLALRLFYTNQWYRSEKQQGHSTIQKSIRWVCAEFLATKKDLLDIQEQVKQVKVLFRERYPFLPFDKHFTELQLHKMRANYS